MGEVELMSAIIESNKSSYYEELICCGEYYVLVVTPKAQ